MRVAQTRRCCEDQGMQKVRALGGNSPGCLQETLSGSSSICRSVDLGHSQSASSISPSNHLHCLLSSFIAPLNHGILPNIYSPLMSKPSLSPSLSPKTSLSPNLLTCYVPLMDSVLIITHSLTHTSSHFGKEKLNMSLFQHILLHFFSTLSVALDR